MRFPLLIIILLFIITTTQAQTTVQPGVSKTLSDYRKTHISHPQYTLTLTIPAEKNTDIQAEEILTFEYIPGTEPLQLDFKEDPKRIKTITINGKAAEIKHNKEHLLLESKYLVPGRNIVQISFLAGNGALNRNDDYLYALFVPDRARTVFPCFDQPNLKATFLLTLNLPTTWKALSNSLIIDSTVNTTNKTYRFRTSDTLSTYLFSFTAGKYFTATQNIGKLNPDFLYRETDQTKIKLSTDAIFKAHADAVNFLQDWTQIPFPFQKMGFVAVPDFQFGGMEHPGEVQYKASSLFLDASATQEQIIARLNLIAHETAHMWFGDMVTMDWFNDVWMKEVFANFMADKVTGSLMGEETFNLKFLTDHFPAAYGIDRTPGANSIRQPLDNLKDAGSLYGNIIYHKAPIMMRQLELLMGKENFQNGLREYLKTYAYRNATWPDLIKILDKYTTEDLNTWNNTWVNQPGRPVFNYSLVSKNGKIKRFLLIQHAEHGAPRTWPQSFDVTLFWGGQQPKTITVNMTKGVFDFKETEGMKRPAYILFNSGGEGYGLFPTDGDLYNSLDNIQSPLQRTSAYISLYENMLAGRYIKPEALLNVYTHALGTEKEEMSLKQITGYISSIYWQFINPQTRLKVNENLENALWQAMQQQTAANNKKILFSTYQSIYLSANARSNIYNVWKQQQPPAGVKLSEEDYTGMAFSLALRNDADTTILTQQYARITNPDRQKRVQFIRPALSNDIKVRDQFFASLADLKNRAKEANVLTALGYLHHPLRQATSVKYLAKSLDMLETIQSTGDIFFPQSWLSSTFGSYQSAEAAHIVTEFLAAHPNYNEKLKAKIQQSTDNLIRASGKLVPRVVVIE
ncbi:ERAP1-like C-terminal domain-containing protein [Mucilaginibacter sp. HMF5004]|uniref:M1 family metallopeptidase n=1 Tax=Mucilaginibacter rivuli TaxID=2857527 RepID=UPI001C5F5458|nr:M1 family aminopeptidase [Mucilaginibacter rivuli]MBW4891308.1 ERAP1-like C-terminal domain-containing protein [Mucilaginibacter rivuli]